MIERKLKDKLLDYAKGFPIICLTGPRQSGKTTLSKATFPTYEYVNLENTHTLERALSDPIQFLTAHRNGLIIDEAQKAPQLFSYLQEIVDTRHKMGEYILTGSQNFSLMETITQSLAGRAGILHLLPLSLQELKNHSNRVDDYLLKGGYPPLYDREISPFDWYNSYTQNYIERDVRQLAQLKDLSTFKRFLLLTAGRCGQLINYSNFANDVGVSHTTIKAWLSLLETSFIIHLLHPYHTNFNKRLIKQPKLYFHDTGLLCSLLNITDTNILQVHPLRGAIFECMIVSEHVKKQYNHGYPKQAYFWRDHHGIEVDLIQEKALGIDAIEIKSSYTIQQDQFKNLNHFKHYAGDKVQTTTLYYSGLDSYPWHSHEVKSWLTLADLKTP
jgi:predicted AAA+ superfamily ATPase